MRVHRHQYDVRLMCRVLEGTPSGYYAWLKQPRSHRAAENARPPKLIRVSFDASNGIYGSPCVFLDLREAGETCSKHRVARPKRENKIRCPPPLSLQLDNLVWIKGDRRDDASRDICAAPTATHGPLQRLLGALAVTLDPYGAIGPRFALKRTRSAVGNCSRTTCMTCSANCWVLGDGTVELPKRNSFISTTMRRCRK
jgi:hypothetical protein